MVRWLVHSPRVAMALPLLPLAAALGCAAHSETNALRQEIDRLNARIEHLEGQGATPPASSSQTAAASPPAPAAAPPVAERPGALRERWQNITYGMTFEQVSALLGRPQRTIDESPKTVWFYSYPDVGNGSVVFVHESGVTDWQAPPFGNWVWWP